MYHPSSSRSVKYVKNISNKKDEKWSNCLFKMKRIK